MPPIPRKLILAISPVTPLLLNPMGNFSSYLAELPHTMSHFFLATFLFQYAELYISFFVNSSSFPSKLKFWYFRALLCILSGGGLKYFQASITNMLLVFTSEFPALPAPMSHTNIRHVHPPQTLSTGLRVSPQSELHLSCALHLLVLLCSTLVMGTIIPSAFQIWTQVSTLILLC